MLYDQRQKHTTLSMPETSRRKLLQAKRAELITARKFFLLFTFLLVALILYPYAGNTGFRYYFFRILSSVVILLSVYAVSFRRSLVLFALLLAVPALLQHAFLYKYDAGFLSILRVSLSFTFEVFIIVVIFRRVFAHKQASAETIFGALCVYLLVGFSFTSLYGILADVQPGAFYLDPMANHHSVPDRFDLVYYSFATLTSVGGAGITPVSGQARSLTVIESILGVLYLAVLISRLVGAYRNHPPEPQQENSE